MGAAVRQNASENDYRGYWLSSGALGSAGSVHLDKYVAGTATNIAQYTNGGGNGLKVSLGDTLMLCVSGTNILMYYNGSPFLAATDSSLASGASGVMLYTGTAVNNSQISSWQGGSFISAPSLGGTLGINPGINNPVTQTIKGGIEN
jgi:pectate lyase